MIREDPLLFEGARWAHVSIAAKDFIACLLQKQPGRRLPPHAHATCTCTCTYTRRHARQAPLTAYCGRRLSARDALGHEWIRQSRQARRHGVDSGQGLSEHAEIVQVTPVHPLHTRVPPCTLDRTHLYTPYTRTPSCP